MNQLKYDNTYPFRPFLFIGERLILDYDSTLPFLKDYFLKVADVKQIAAIKEIVQPDELLRINSSSGLFNIYENELLIEVVKGGSTTTAVPLNSTDFKYWVIELSDSLFDNNLFMSILLMTKRLTIIAQVGKLGVYNFDYLKAAIFYSDISLISNSPVEVGEKDLIEIQDIYDSIIEFLKGIYGESSISKSLTDFISVGRIEYSSPFKIIALFSIIESLLVTNNKNSDQSINRQLQKKIKLVNNQLLNPIDFRKYFKGPNTLTEELIIEKLYTYRSKIAHGDYYDFNNELQILGDHNKIYEFLLLLTKRILLFGIKRSQLMLDIKEC